MYDVMDVARYVVNYSNEKGYSISNLKLQKLIYYIQAGFLVDTSDKCFDETIICWKHGPVVRKVYDSFKKYTDGNIPVQENYNKLDIIDGEWTLKNIKFNENFLSECDRIRINKVIDGLSKYSAWDLVERTHEESPWDDLKEYNLVITGESIKEYFNRGDNRKRIYGEFN